jgi:hypothetical protein
MIQFSSHIGLSGARIAYQRAQSLSLYLQLLLKKTGTYGGMARTLAKGSSALTAINVFLVFF